MTDITADFQAAFVIYIEQCPEATASDSASLNILRTNTASIIFVIIYKEKITLIQTRRHMRFPQNSTKIAHGLESTFASETFGSLLVCT